jgi:hypothetical protein
MDFFLGGWPDTESRNDGLPAEEVFATGINDAKDGKARALGGVLGAEQLVQIAGLKAHFGAG